MNFSQRASNAWDTINNLVSLGYPLPRSEIVGGSETGQINKDMSYILQIWPESGILGFRLAWNWTCDDVLSVHSVCMYLYNTSTVDPGPMHAGKWPALSSGSKPNNIPADLQKEQAVLILLPPLRPPSYIYPSLTFQLPQTVRCSLQSSFRRGTLLRFNPSD